MRGVNWNSNNRNCSVAEIAAVDGLACGAASVVDEPPMCEADACTLGFTNMNGACVSEYAHL